ncbi:hypothetical protein EUGRSUZ_G01895 [Eucalyptus grandis]|uniref:Uncharacterized protein n=2 Tax=Eucalyptus grandis TaxID=71139 RepID=A0ACC3K3K4_EUCGR|nr:hypothetical protein EUGRSUZ_G01895 [Eucalyptus grandis]
MDCQTMSGHIKLSHSGRLLSSQFQHVSLHGISRIRQFCLGVHGEFLPGCPTKQVQFFCICWSHYSLELLVIRVGNKHSPRWTWRRSPNSVPMVYV